MIFPTISLRIERWKFNKDYGVYVSTLGNFKDRYKRNLPIKIDRDGYCRVYTECPHPWKAAHRLVMLTWKHIPDAENLTVDHLNHNKRDNSLANLEWVTEEENHKRANEDYLPDVGMQPPKLVSPFSDKCPIDRYRQLILGYEVNGIVYKGADEIWATHGATFSYNLNRQMELKRAIGELYDRTNTSGTKRIGTKDKKIIVKVVFKNDSN